MHRKTKPLISYASTNAKCRFSHDVACFEVTMQENWSLGFLISSDTNRSVQLCKRARSLQEGRLDYQSSENTGVEQLCSYCTADLRLCFAKGKNLVFSWNGTINNSLLFLHNIVLFVFDQSHCLSFCKVQSLVKM